MIRPSVRILDGELQSAGDLTASLRRLQTDFVYEDPAIERQRFGFVDSGRHHPRSAVVEVNSHPLVEKVLTMHRNESVFAALVIHGEISRWVVEAVFARTNGIYELRLVPMDPYHEALAKERIHFGKKTPHVPETAPPPAAEPDPSPTAEEAPRKKKRKKDAKS